MFIAQLYACAWIIKMALHTVEWQLAAFCTFALEKEAREESSPRALLSSPCVCRLQAWPQENYYFDIKESYLHVAIYSCHLVRKWLLSHICTRAHTPACDGLEYLSWHTPVFKRRTNTTHFVLFVRTMNGRCHLKLHFIIRQSFTLILTLFILFLLK